MNNVPSVSGVPANRFNLPRFYASTIALSDFKTSASDPSLHMNVKWS